MNLTLQLFVWACIKLTLLVNLKDVLRNNSFLNQILIANITKCLPYADMLLSTLHGLIYPIFTMLNEAGTIIAPIL